MIRTGSAWITASVSDPCPICKKTDWCCWPMGGEIVLCQRVQSDRRAKNDNGWIHRIGSTPGARWCPEAKPRERYRLANPCALLERWARDTTPDQVGLFARRMGVSDLSLMRLGVTLAKSRDAWAFPMRRGDGKVIGIRLRGEKRKWAITGSGAGLFFDPDLLRGGELTICEGPTDTAAGLTLGLDAVGRASCSGGHREMISLITHRRVRQVVIIADDDMPGRNGAHRLAATLAIRWKILTFPTKDLRAFVMGGGTRALIDSMLDGQEWAKP